MEGKRVMFRTVGAHVDRARAMYVLTQKQFGFWGAVRTELATIYLH